MAVYLGIDVGSVTTKFALLNQSVDICRIIKEVNYE